VIASIDAGAKPMSVALQRDGKYLWVGNDATEDASSGITAIDTATLTVAAQLKTGAGHHDIAFTEDDSVAFVTNKQSGTVSAIDVRKLAMVAEIKVGALPSALAFSPLSKALYVANEGDGTIVAVDASRLEIVASMKAQPDSARYAPSRWSLRLAVNRATDTVQSSTFLPIVSPMWCLWGPRRTNCLHRQLLMCAPPATSS
jgi:YVTN family beta-propeller protein